MALTPVPPIEPVLPAPPNPLDDETTFDAAAYAWSAALPGFGSDLEAIGSATYANALEAVASATTAATQVNLATTQATNAANSAIAAANSTASNGVLWVSGATYAVGVLVYSPATLLTYRRRVAGAGTIDPSADTANWASQTPSTLLNKAYDLRGDLRSMTPAPRDAAIVDGLGLFVWASGSTEPDDDESCFVTTSGAWLLEAAHWDLVDSWQSPEWQAISDDDEDEPLRFASRIFTAPYTNTVSSVSGNSTLTQGVTVTGASVGDAVIITRSGVSATAPQGVVFGVVTASNTVTVYYCAPSPSAANFLTTGNWLITIIKQ